MFSTKQVISFGFFLAITVLQSQAQTSNNSLLPYNPDIDGNGTIEVTDLMGFYRYLADHISLRGHYLLQTEVLERQQSMRLGLR